MGYSLGMKSSARPAVRPALQLRGIRGPVRVRAELLDNQADILKKTAVARKEALMDSILQGQNASGAASTTDSEAAALRERLNKAVEAMQAGLVERDTEVRLLLLAALSGEHILYLGPPGTAKSELGRRLSRVTKGTYFERLLTRFSVPEELFGPLSMRALEEDQYVRQTRGYLPDSKVAFIDEIFKANSAILNTLLTILNERLFDNGSQRTKVPLVCLVGASNELPESEELDALYDRFLLRKQVQQVSPAGLSTLLSALSAPDDGLPPSPAADSAKKSATKKSTAAAADTDAAPEPYLRDDDFSNVRKEALGKVRVGADVVNLLADVRDYLQTKSEPPVYVSDRRLVKAVNMLKVAAYTNGRSSVSLYDCILLRHALWQRPEEQERIYEYLVQTLTADDGIKQCRYLLSSLYGRSCRAGTDDRLCEDLLVELRSLKSVLADKMTGLAANVAGAFPVVTNNLWLGRDEAQALASALGPKLGKTKSDVESLLLDLLALESALEARTEPVVLAEMLPKYWNDFIRNGNMDDVKKIGLDGKW